MGSIKMFRREAGKDFVVVTRGGSIKNLIRKSKRACRELPILLCDLAKLWRSVRGSQYLPDQRRPPQIRNDLFQQFHLLGEQPEPSNSCDVPSGCPKLDMKPSRTGSNVPSMTMGMVVVSRFSALT